MAPEGCGKKRWKDGQNFRGLRSLPRNRILLHFSGSIGRSAIPKQIKEHGLPKSIPIVIIGRLARDTTYAGKGLGSDLLSDALKRILTAAATIGVRGVLVHALDDNSSFYEKNGFLPCPIGERTFFLPIKQLCRRFSAVRYLVVREPGPLLDFLTDRLRMTAKRSHSGGAYPARASHIFQQSSILTERVLAQL